MNHAWCHDIERDAAVRAAEDNRTGPLPTLEECMEAPFTQAAKRSAPVSEMGDGQSGPRTERVMLECVHRFWKPPREWDWWRLMELRPGESVRVVDHQRESHLDAQRGVIETLTRQRDAAIREREDLREQLESVACRAATAETALEAASGGNRPENPEGSTQAASGGGEGEPVAWGVVQSDSVVTTRLKEHEAKKASEVWLSSTVVPLYRAPPQPRGWLTDEEREAVNAARDYFDDDDHGDSECVFIARVLKQLLARSLPPGPEGE